MFRVTLMVASIVCQQVTPVQPPVADCVTARITGYVRTAPYFAPTTADGTSILTDEPIVAASYDIPLQTMVTIDGLGTFRVADRGHLEVTHIDVAVWSYEEAYAITSYRRVCIQP